MAAGYSIVALEDLLNEYGENRTKLILSTFSCHKNPDVEIFLKSKATVFEAQGISKTHLVFASFQKKNVLVGYFALANKVIVVTKSKLSGTWRKRLNKFSTYNSVNDAYSLSAPLIGQLGKNFTNDYNKQITGDELLLLACDTVREAQRLIGGRLVYLECEDKPELTEFYSQNGFVKFDERRLEEHEKTTQCGTYLVQMFKYLK